MSGSNNNTAIPEFISVVLGLLLISYACNQITVWIITSGEGAEWSIWGFILVIIVIPLAIGAIPSGICTTISAYLFGFSTGGWGIDSTGEVLIFLVLIIGTIITTLHATRSPTGHWLATGLSYFTRPTVGAAQTFKKRESVREDPETVKEETARQKKAADLNDAIREMERAKAKLDEFKRHKK